MSLINADFHWIESAQIYELDIKDEYAKTFGQKIKLILSSHLLKEHLNGKALNDQFFTIDWLTFTRHIKRLFTRVLSDQITIERKKYIAK